LSDRYLFHHDFFYHGFSSDDMAFPPMTWALVPAAVTSSADRGRSKAASIS
jgi:hypothetical protein